MISTRNLDTAKISISGNEWLQPLYGLVQVYNSMETSPDRNEKVRILERLLGYSTYWITSKPPKNTPTNMARWKALEGLANDVAKEMDGLGGKMLSGPSNWKDVKKENRHYWLEKVDPQHRPGFELSTAYGAWLNSRVNLSFWDYCRLFVKPSGLQVKQYIDDAEAKKNEVGVKHGIFRTLDPMNDSPFDTRNNQTLFAGKGWAIFVVDMDGRLYCGDHEEGKFHHSTFLAGGAVQAAGELAAENGEIKVVTAKSGHYTPGEAQMLQFLKLFPQVSGSAIIRPDFFDVRDTGEPRFYRVKQFRFEGKKAKSLKRAEVVKAIPTWAMSNNATTLVGKISA
ncbi:MAG: hypothetical protein JST93_28235 [Acidobacteria bacterium]|nr:hypothetical protein [Acidobacteriota bacterium]